MFFVCLSPLAKRTKLTNKKQIENDYSEEITQINQNKNKLYLMRVTFDSCRNW